MENKINLNTDFDEDLEDGIIEKYNLDLYNRPIVKNKDGTISTIRSLGFDTDKGYLLIPSVSKDGKILTPNQAINEFRITGEHLGVYKNRDIGDRYAQKLHQQQQQFYQRSMEKK